VGEYTLAFTQDGRTGIVATDFASGHYEVGVGHQKRIVAWKHYTVNEEPLTNIRTHYIHRVGANEIELPRGSRPEMDEIEGEGKPNFTGRLLISIDPVDANV
jgi:hypothetical protein